MKPVKKPTRVCVLQGRAAREWTLGRCLSRRHGHVTLETAEAMVARGMAEWEFETVAMRNGRTRKRRLPVIRLVAGRRWQKTICRDGYSSVAVMQMVSGG